MGNVDLRCDVMSESIAASCGGKALGGSRVVVAAGVGAGGGGAVVCGATGLFSLFVSEGELDRRGSVGDDGNGARKFSGKSEPGRAG